MRIRDLIPDREALISPDFYRRKNLLVQVIEDDEAPLRSEGRRTADFRRSDVPTSDVGERRSTAPFRDANATGNANRAGRATSPTTRNGGDDQRDERRSPHPHGRPQQRLLRHQPQRGRPRRRRPARARRGTRGRDPQPAPADAAVRRSELGLRGHRAAQPRRPEDRGHSVQPRQGDPAERRRQQPRAAAGRRRHDLQREGRARAGVAPDAPRVARRRGQFAGRLPAAARRHAAQPADAGRRLHAAGLCLRPRVQPRGDAAAPAREPGLGDHAAADALGGAGRARRGQPARRPDRRRDQRGGQQRGDAGAGGAALADRAERPHRARADAGDAVGRRPAGPAARELGPHHRAVAARLRHGRRRGRQQQRVRLEAGPHRRRIPAPRRRRRGRRPVQHVHPARRRHRDQGRRQARLVQPRRPRIAGDAARRCADRADRARLRDLGPGAGAQPEGLRADLLGLRHRHRRDQLAQVVNDIAPMRTNDLPLPMAARPDDERRRRPAGRPHRPADLARRRQAPDRASSTIGVAVARARRRAAAAAGLHRARDDARAGLAAAERLGRGARGTRLAGLAGGLAPKSPDELYVALLKSDSVDRALAQRFDLKSHYDVDTFEALRKVLPSYVRVPPTRRAALIGIEVDDKSPKFAADLANAHADEVGKLLGRLAVSEAQLRRVFFENQLNETKENLVKAEQALQGVQEKSGVIVLDKQAEALIGGAAQLRAQITEREVQLKVLRTSATDQNPDVMRLTLGAARAARRARADGVVAGPGDQQRGRHAGRQAPRGLDRLRARAARAEAPGDAARKHGPPVRDRQARRSRRKARRCRWSTWRCRPITSRSRRAR